MKMFRVWYEVDDNGTLDRSEEIVEAVSEARAIEWVSEMIEQNRDGDVTLLEISAEEIQVNG